MSHFSSWHLYRSHGDMCRIHQRTTDLWNKPSPLDSRMKQRR
jgi:hypothetical protein